MYKRQGHKEKEQYQEAMSDAKENKYKQLRYIQAMDKEEDAQKSELEGISATNLRERRQRNVDEWSLGLGAISSRLLTQDRPKMQMRFQLIKTRL